MDLLLKGLNAAQRAAVTSKASILQVLAPPGSGKTKTLTSRVAYLLAHEGYNAQNVICCTFTIKAAREMRERLRGLIGGDIESRLVLGTFHSICRRYLVTYGHLIGIPQNFGIADSDDSLGIIKRLQKKMQFGMDPRAARNKISHRKARGQTIDKVTKTTPKTAEAREFLEIFQQYEDALAVSNLLDYDDLLLRCVELLRRHPSCVSNIEALLIDEFQDTNNVQFELMKLLASANKRITIVGDPDQSIYGFRSAEIENLKRMQEFYSDTVVINLEENYRSSSAVLHLAQDVIEQDLERPSKKLKSTHCYGTQPVLRKLHNPHEEAAWIVSEIKRITRMTGGCIEYSNIAILLRSAFLSLLIEKALANTGIPYKMVGGRRFFDRVEVRILLDYLRVINHPDNNSALLSIINTPARKVGDTTVAELSRAAEAEKVSLWTTIQKAVRGEVKLEKKLARPAEQGLRELVRVVQNGRDKLKTFEAIQAPGQLIELICTELGFLEYLKKQYSEDWEERWENVKELSTQARDVSLNSLATEDRLPEIDGVQQARSDDSHETLSRFLANVALSTEVEAEGDEAKARITISTIHSAKGLEWPVVFVPAVYEGSIPHSRAENTDEERRLLYVAMTRAKALLYLTFPMMQSRSESESIISQFLASGIDHRVKEAGPIFDDRLVADIASILGRPTPSSESVVQGIALIEDNESQYDDIWPLDGSPRMLNMTQMANMYSSVLQGQNLSEALKVRTNFQQTSSFSTVATAGFTTASHQMSIMPQVIDAVQAQQKPKIVKSMVGQSQISTFFGKGTHGEVGKENLPPLPIPKSSIIMPAISSTTQAIIPVELSSHRPILSTTRSGVSIKRSRSEFEGKNSTAQKPYSCFSSSPVTENFPAEQVSDHAEASNHEVNKTRTFGIVQGYNTTMSTLQNSKSRPPSAFSTYKSGMLNPLSKPTPLSTVSGVTAGTASLKRTLGVRRSMTGWADRKNK